MNHEHPLALKKYIDLQGIDDMSNMPDIFVQIVHIEGARKGEIDEFQQSVISIGRAHSSDVLFPGDIRVVSRTHAEIKREGNRYLLINHSRNGCFVNRLQVDQSYLNQGDIITFSKAGPKISFLYTLKADARSVTLPEPGMSGELAKQSFARKQKGLFTLQFGTDIRSFTQHVVTLGKHHGNDFVLNHQSVLETHCEIYFQEDNYFLRDTSQCQATMLNGSVLIRDRPLYKKDIITLGKNGPQLYYMGAGRLFEFVNPLPAQSDSTSSRSISPETRQTPVYKATIGDLIKSFFRQYTDD